MTEHDLHGRKALVIVTNSGVEQDELLRPVQFLQEHGAEVTIAAPETGEVKTLVGDAQPGRSAQAEATLDEVDPAGYDVVVVPGGTENGAAIRGLERAQDIVNAFAKDLKPIAAICHAPWLLADAGLAQGATMTSYPELEDDLKAAGATWVDRDVVVDDHGGVTVITSRTPKDLDAFTKAIETALVG